MKHNTEYLINHVYLSDSPESDMTAKEMQYIKEYNENKLGHIDLADIMYDAYKLGYAKGILSTGQQLPKKK